MPFSLENDTKDMVWNLEEEITYEQVKGWSEDPESGIMIIDVREALDFETGHIPNSKNLPLTIFEQSLSKDQVDFVRTYGFPRPGLEDKIVLYCRSGRRSTIAADLARGAGFSRVRNYKGSWLEYEAKSGAQAGAAKSV
ncbi:BQ2448_3160 [Microbotryum intermedium]|uniref:BQ2448_3160 protein n=1 Tax=Microbotryum intermedium TaxID=269621 RepID=A0A238FCL0_9BASI|nr:BQ2448_3160 [Microbotryum intermedium]